MVFQHTVKHHIDISALSINTTRTKISVYKELTMNKNDYIIRLERKEEYRDVAGIPHYNLLQIKFSEITAIRNKKQSF